MIQFILMVNKQGQTRISKYYNSFSVQEKITLEGELIRKCLSRTEGQVRKLIQSLKVYSAHFQNTDSIKCYTGDMPRSTLLQAQTMMRMWYVTFKLPQLFQNELSMLEFIHNLVETMDKYFENVVSTFSITFNFLIVRARCKKLFMRLLFSISNQ